jgi:hypothetical protein
MVLNLPLWGGYNGGAVDSLITCLALGITICKAAPNR